MSRARRSKKRSPRRHRSKGNVQRRSVRKYRSAETPAKTPAKTPAVAKTPHNVWQSPFVDGDTTSTQGKLTQGLRRNVESKPKSPKPDTGDASVYDETIREKVLIKQQGNHDCFFRAFLQAIYSTPLFLECDINMRFFLEFFVAGQWVNPNFQYEVGNQVLTGAANVRGRSYDEKTEPVKGKLYHIGHTLQRCLPDDIQSLKWGYTIDLFHTAALNRLISLDKFSHCVWYNKVHGVKPKDFGTVGWNIVTVPPKWWYSDPRNWEDDRAVAHEDKEFFNKADPKWNTYMNTSVEQRGGRVSEKTKVLKPIFKHLRHEVCFKVDYAQRVTIYDMNFDKPEQYTFTNDINEVFTEHVIAIIQKEKFTSSDKVVIKRLLQEIKQDFSVNIFSKRKDYPLRTANEVYGEDAASLRTVEKPRPRMFSEEETEAAIYGTPK